MNPAAIQAITVISVIANIILGLFVFYKNTKSATNRLFFLLNFSIAAWDIANYFSVSHAMPHVTLIWIRLVMLFSTLLSACFFLLIYTFPEDKIYLNRKIYYPYLVLIVGTMAASISPYLFTHIVVEHGNTQPVPGPLFPLFVISAVGSVISGIVLLIYKYLKAQGTLRTQLRFILIGTMIMFFLILFSNVFLVLFVGNSSLVSLSGFYTFLFVTAVAYTIVRHRFLDIRLILARSVGYTLFGIVFAGFYTVILFVVSNYFFDGKLANYQAIVYAILALLIAFSFQPLKRTLETITDIIFFKGGYQTHELIGRLTKIMAMTVDLKTLATQILYELLQTMRVEKGAFYIFSDTRLFPAIQQGFPSNNILPDIAVAKLTIERRLILFDEEKNESIKALMSSQGIKVVLPLFLKGKELGILILGDKKSGDAYSSHDINVLEIVSPEMSVAIENAKSYEEIRQFNVTLSEKVEKATEQLRNANTRLQELDKLKDEFVSLASHELRTPMTAIKSYLWMVIYGKDSQLSPKQRKYLDVAYFSTERLINLVNDMLNVSRIESGRIMLEKQSAVLDALVQSVVDEVTPRVQELGLHITIADHDPLPQVFIDETKIREVLTNLLGNSLKFTPAGGTVTISFRILEGFVEVDVSDTGRGILPEDKPKLFQKFGLIAGSYTQKTISQGTGLGLYITKSIIEMHGGKIGADSKGRDKGATFFFTLPVYNPMAAVIARADSPAPQKPQMLASPNTSLPHATNLPA